MSRPIYQYQVDNFNPDRAVGILLPFNKAVDGKTISQNYASGSVGGGGVFNLSYTTEEQSISNLKNLLLTRKGERYMQPNFGTNIYATLFEPNTELIREELQLSLQDDIAFWLPYITVNELDVIGDIDNYSISIRIRYQVTNSNVERVIVVLANENELLLSEIDNNPTKLKQIGLF